jgi:hypothetical protein
MDERFGEVITSWLAKLPREAWCGTNDTLGAELDELNESGKFYAYIPWKSGLSKALLHAEPAITAVGWVLSFPRTAQARLIQFTKRRVKK